MQLQPIHLTDIVLGFFFCMNINFRNGLIVVQGDCVDEL